MKRILEFTISMIVVTMLFSNSYGQDTIMRIRGLRVGADLSRLALQYVDKERNGYEFSVDFEAFKNFYPTVHYGWQTLSVKKNEYQYSSTGSYWRIGAEYNALKKIKYNQYEMVFVGLGYGFSSFTQQADSVYINDNHWGDYYTSILPMQYKDGWIEVTSGIRAELFKNFFIGWYFSGRILLWHTHDSPLVPYKSPGFGTIEQKSSLGFNYSVYYRIPLFKVRYEE